MFDSSIPNKDERSRIASDDPVATAKYFDLVVDNLLTKLLAYKHKDGGILGHVNAFFGTVEEQGRGDYNSMTHILQCKTIREGIYISDRLSRSYEQNFRLHKRL